MGGSGHTFTIQEILEAKAEEAWWRKGVPEEDIAFSRVSGMDAGDIRGFRKFTARGLGYLIFVRCPKRTARPHHNIFQSKPGYASDAKSGTSGLLSYKKEIELADGTTKSETKLFVSDYDLMSFWRRSPRGFEKVVVSAPGGLKRGGFSFEATVLICELNGCMESRSRIQHGCQDDWISPENPGVRPGGHFAAFNVGAAEYLDSPSALGYYYRRFHLPWPYDGAGGHNPSRLA